MIFTSHLVIGATIGAEVMYLPLVAVLAFLSHYLLDFIPHVEYPINNILKKNWKKSAPDFLRVFSDFIVGVFFFFSIHVFTNTPYLILSIGVFFAVLPDIIEVVYHIFPKNRFLKWHYNMHDKVHFLAHKKIPNFWRVFSQIAAAAMGLIILLY